MFLLLKDSGVFFLDFAEVDIGACLQPSPYLQQRIQRHIQPPIKHLYTGINLHNTLQIHRLILGLGIPILQPHHKLKQLQPKHHLRTSQFHKPIPNLQQRLQIPLLILQLQPIEQYLRLLSFRALL